jgi:hypothetical protein
MEHHDADAAQRAGARQQDAVRLARQRIARREGVFGDKGPDRLGSPDGTNAICEVENPATSPPKLSISNARPRTAGSLAAASIWAAIPS